VTAGRAQQAVHVRSDDRQPGAFLLLINVDNKVEIRCKTDVRQ